MSWPVRLAALALVLCGCARRLPDAASRPYAALDLPAVGPTPYRPAQLQGKVVLASFFATWCFPCIAELPVLEKLQRTHEAQGFTVVLVGLDLEGATVIAPFADHYALPFPVLVADEQLRAGLAPFGRVTALPTSFLFDRDGRLVFAYQGVAAAEDLMRVVATAVKR